MLILVFPLGSEARILQPASNTERLSTFMPRDSEERKVKAESGFQSTNSHDALIPCPA